MKNLFRFVAWAIGAYVYMCGMQLIAFWHNEYAAFFIGIWPILYVFSRYIDTEGMKK